MKSFVLMFFLGYFEAFSKHFCDFFLQSNF